MYTSGTQKCKGAAAYFQSNPVDTSQTPRAVSKDGLLLVLSTIFSIAGIDVSPVCQ
jgi:hypothetical protein